MANEYHLDCSLSRETRATLDDFTFGYIEAAMWTLTDDDGYSLDYLGLHDIAESTLKVAIRECVEFRAQVPTLLDVALEAGVTDASLGTDFWLTRNRHGAGYWDGGYAGTLGEALTDAAHSMGEATWYLGDDGFVYQMGDE